MIFAIVVLVVSNSEPPINGLLGKQNEITSQAIKAGNSAR